MAKKHTVVDPRAFAIPLGSMFVMLALTIAVAVFNNQSLDTRSRADIGVYPTATPFFTPTPPTPTPTEIVIPTPTSISIPTPTSIVPIVGASCINAKCVSGKTFYYCQPDGTYAAPITCSHYCDMFDDPSRGCNCIDYSGTFYPPYATICRNKKEWVCDWKTGTFYESIRKCK